MNLAFFTYKFSIFSPKAYINSNTEMSNMSSEYHKN